MRIRSAMATLLVAALLTGAGCAATSPRIVDVRDVSRAGSTPEVEKIVDLGRARLEGRTLAITGGDGRGVIGELLLLRGDDFGKQPTVTIGGMPAEVVAHTSSGGIVVRIPWGIDPGDVAVRVENGHGSTQARFSIARLAVVATGGKLHLASVTATGDCKTQHTLPLRGGERLTISTAGAAALVAGGHPPHLTVVDLTASPPATRASHRLPGERIADVTVASHAPLGAAVTDTHVVFIDQRRTGHIALYTALELPPEVREAGVVAATMSPRGDRLALALGKGNRVALFDTRQPTALPEPRLFDVLPGVPLELLISLRFSGDGSALWVLSGNNPASIAGGDQPTRLSLVEGLDGEPSVGDPLEVAGSQVPQGVAMARGEPTPAGTSIRAASGRSALFVGAYPRELLQAGKKLEPPAKLDGRTTRLEPGKKAAVLGRGSWVVGALDVAGKSQVVVSLAAGWSGGQPAWLLVGHKAWGDTKLRSVRLAERPAALSPSALGALRLQP